jgi:hypothetical protein
MDQNTPHFTTRTLALLLVAASTAIAGCDAEDEAFYEEELAEMEAFEDDGLEDEAALDDAVLAAIADAPELVDEDVEALFADHEPTLREVIGLVDEDLLPAGLTLEDLDLPVVLGTSEPPGDAAELPEAFATEIEPQFIGEQACATTSIANLVNGATVPMTPAPNCSFQQDSATSPNTSYNPAGCPNQFITHVTGTYGKGLQFFSSWQGVSLNQTNCGLARKTLSAYGGRWTVSFVNGMWQFSLQWTKLGTTIEHGEWSSGPWLSGCYWDYDNGYGPLPNLSNGHNYDRVRTAAQGLVLALFPFKQRIESGIWHGSGPC